MGDSWESAWRSYMTGVEGLQGAVQQLSLVPLEEMEAFLGRAIGATVPDGDSPRRKIRAAQRQLELIRASIRYMSEVTPLLKRNDG